MSRIHGFLKGLAAVLVLSAASLSAWAQERHYPEAPITLLVGYGAGGATDRVARAIGPMLSEKLKQPVVIVNRPGASGALALRTLKSAPADGYTLALAATAALSILPHTTDAGYDPLADFTFVTSVAFTDLVCVVNAAIPARNLAELLALSKAKPDLLMWSTPGSGSVSHFVLEMLKRDFELKALHVPYKTSTDYLPDLAEGRVNVACDTYPVVRSLIDTGKVKAIGVTGRVRQPSLQHLPTLAETHPGVVFEGGFGLVAPGNLPPAIVERIGTAMQEVLADPKIMAEFAKVGLAAIWREPANYTKEARAEYDQYGRLARMVGLSR